MNIISTKIIFSIPGRLRIKVFDCIKNNILGSSITTFIKNIEGINTISFNKNTGNILILYKEDSIKEIEIIDKINTFKLDELSLDNIVSQHEVNSNDIILNSMNPFYLLKRKYEVKTYKDEYNLSKNLLKMGIFLGFLSFMFSFNISTLISILILSYPGIIFTISSMVNYYSAKKANDNKIYMKNIYSLKSLGRANSILIEDDLLISKNINLDNYLLEDENIDKFSILKLILLKKINDPLDINIKQLIKNIRNHGFTELIIFSNKNNIILDYISYSLGIDIKEYNYIKENLEFSKDKIIITTQNHLEEINNLNRNLVIYVYDYNHPNSQDIDIALSYENLYKIPWLIHLSKYNKEVILRRQLSAISVNIIGIFLASVRFLNIFSSLGLYALNIIVQNIIAKNEINKQGVVYD